ncbi:hypothetical protein [Streptomyces sp. NPDC090036]
MALIPPPEVGGAASACGFLALVICAALAACIALALHRLTRAADGRP